MTISALLLSFLLVTQADDRVIGTVDGKSVLESQVKGSTPSKREESLRALFVSPALSAYLDSHKEQWKLNDKEVEQLVVAYRNSLKCSTAQVKPMEPAFERLFAEMVGGGAKVQRFIYEHNGRGRILFQQAGAEAFDATRNLILKLEKEGRITFNDLDVRAMTLKYWLNDHQAGLLKDPGPDKAFKLDQLVPKCPQDR